MNYKILSHNEQLLQKAQAVFAAASMQEAIHTQRVDIWLLDVKALDKTALDAYKLLQKNTNLLFLVRNVQEVAFCLENAFTHYLFYPFLEQELLAWLHFFHKKAPKKELFCEEELGIDFEKKCLLFNDSEITLSQQELKLLTLLSHGSFMSTQKLVQLLDLGSSTSVRSIINRLRKKSPVELFEQRRQEGYRLRIKEVKKERIDSFVEELKEQNALMQTIIDSSPIFIITFVHKKLYCINKSFRNFLGTVLIECLWQEAEGNFFELIPEPLRKKAQEELFLKGKHSLALYNFLTDSTYHFKVQTFYFANLDKHLLVCEPL